MRGELSCLFWPTEINECLSEPAGLRKTSDRSRTWDNWNSARIRMTIRTARIGSGTEERNSRDGAVFRSVGFITASTTAAG